jgi:uncharacterized protein
MKETYVRFLEKPILKDPIAIEGLPGIGLVGKLVADHLINVTKAKKFCELYSPHFPPQVVIQDDGTVRLVKNDFYHFKDKGRDFVILAGDFQGMTPDSQYEISSVIFNVFKELGVRRIYTLGGLGTGRIVKSPKVFAAASDKKLVPELEKHGLLMRDRGGGGIFGASGLLLGFAQTEKIEAVCFMGETIGQLVDAKAARVLLMKLAEVLDIKVDMTDLDKSAKKTEKELEKLRKLQEEQVRAQQMATVTTPEDDVSRYIR